MKPVEPTSRFVLSPENQKNDYRDYDQRKPEQRQFLASAPPGLRLLVEERRDHDSERRLQVLCSGAAVPCFGLISKSPLTNLS